MSQKDDWKNPQTDDFEMTQAGDLPVPQTEGAETPKAEEAKPDGVHMSKKAVVVWSALALLLLVIFGTAIYQHFFVDIILNPPDKNKMPSIVFEDAAGEEFNIEDFRGELLVINFWTTKCQYCVEEMPLFKDKSADYGDEIRFLFINVVGWNGEKKENGLGFFQNNGYEMDLYFCTINQFARMPETASLPLPYTIFVDAEGYIVDYHIGKISENRLLAGIHALLDPPENENGNENEEAAE
ncbi:MAG: TlpA family protein disulfide reductase [Clostridiales bacterium]|nr:TlpA family protein disulfide reductase [Clostridiales bacterium]